jgi:hypothetical protein
MSRMGFSDVLACTSPTDQACARYPPKHPHVAATLMCAGHGLVNLWARRQAVPATFSTGTSTPAAVAALTSLCTGRVHIVQSVYARGRTVLRGRRIGIWQGTCRHALDEQPCQGQSCV